MVRKDLPGNEPSLKIQREINQVIKGLPHVIRLVTIAVFAQGQHPS